MKHIYAWESVPLHHFLARWENKKPHACENVLLLQNIIDAVGEYCALNSTAQEEDTRSHAFMSVHGACEEHHTCKRRGCSTGHLSRLLASLPNQYVGALEARSKSRSYIEQFRLFCPVRPTPACTHVRMCVLWILPPGFGEGNPDMLYPFAHLFLAVFLN